ncbi:MAG TPA: hypothetical protein DDZ88_14160 [Verrucomicrobiales bacterium]|nr:hypothetical protein [Verrucomicrobiales bacterium]
MRILNILAVLSSKAGGLLNASYPTMKKTTLLLCCLAAVLMTQCSAPQAPTPSSVVTLASPTLRGTVTTQTLGNATVMTRRLINRPLTNKDVGKVLEEVTVVSPSGTSVQERVIVRALPRLETKNLTKS